MHQIGIQHTNARHWINSAIIAERKDTSPEYADRKKLTDVKYKT